VTGKKGNVEIVKVKNQQILIQAMSSLQQTKYTVEKPMIIVEYRFQKYEFNYDLDLFEPIIFKSNLTYNQIIETYSGGVANDS